MANQCGYAKTAGKKKMAEILEVRRICGECWEEERITTHLYEFDEDGLIVNIHNHKAMIVKKDILKALEK